MELIDRNVLFLAVSQAVGGLGGEIEERLDGLAGAVAGLRLEELAQQDQDRDHGRGLKVETDFPVLAEGFGENTWHQDCHRAEEIGCPDAYGDEGEHVEAAIDDRAPALDEKDRTGPEDHRGGKGELDPLRDAF